MQISKFRHYLFNAMCFFSALLGCTTAVIWAWSHYTVITLQRRSGGTVMQMIASRGEMELNSQPLPIDPPGDDMPPSFSTRKAFAADNLTLQYQHPVVGFAFEHRELNGAMGHFLVVPHWSVLVALA